jgi:hypothetical protein
MLRVRRGVPVPSPPRTRTTPRYATAFATSFATDYEAASRAEIFVKGPCGQLVATRGLHLATHGARREAAICAIEAELESWH